MMARGASRSGAGLPAGKARRQLARGAMRRARSVGGAAVVAGALVKATVRRAAALHDPRPPAAGAALWGALAAAVAGALVAYVAFGVHGIDVVAALNRDAAFVSTDSFPTEIAHLFGKPGVFPVDHDLLKAALVAIVAAPDVAHVARLRLDRRLGLDAAGDRRDEHVAAGVVHPVAAAARGDRARPAPARRDAGRAGAVHRCTRSRRCWPGDNERRHLRPRRTGRPARRRRAAGAAAALAGVAAPARAGAPRPRATLRRIESTLLVLALCSAWRWRRVNDTVPPGARQRRLTARPAHVARATRATPTRTSRSTGHCSATSTTREVRVRQHAAPAPPKAPDRSCACVDRRARSCTGGARCTAAGTCRRAREDPRPLRVLGTATPVLAGADRAGTPDSCRR